MYRSGSNGLSRIACSACSTAVASSPFHARTIELKPRASAEELDSANDRSNAAVAVSKSLSTTATAKAAVANAAASSAPKAIALRAWRRAAAFVSLMETAAQIPLLVTPGDHRVRRGVVRLQLDRSLEQGQGLVRVLGHR